MYDQIQEDILFCMFYAIVAMLSLIAGFYLMFRRANAIAPDVTSSVRLRRWTAAFFVAMTMSHVWYLPILFLTSSNDVKLTYLVGALLDCMTLFPLAIVVLLAMLQDRRRPLWSAWVIVVPLVTGMTFCIATHSDAIVPMLRIYNLLMGIGFIIYMVREVRRYGRWLRDNYADLEHKEVWHSFIVLAVMMLVFGIYTFAIKGQFFQYVQQVNNVLLTCYLLWRVETLSDLSISRPQSVSVNEETVTTEEEDTHDDIGPLLQRYCIDSQLYLQHDLTVTQLAQAIGTNRFYLSQYFTRQGTTYNAYINDLRINHFVSLYREAIADLRPFTAQQLAHESGYRSYSTFSLAFKQRMGQSVTVWMRNSTSH